MRWWWYEDRRKACENGWYVCDSRQKVPTIGHVGQLTCPTVGTFCLLSQTYHPFSHAFLLSSYHHHLTTIKYGCISQHKILYTACLILLFHLGWFSRLFGHRGCRRQWWPFCCRGGGTKSITCCIISILFLIFYKLISSTWDRWIYWWWNTYRKWVSDSTTYVVEYHAKWRRLGWSICKNPRTILVSQDETHCRGRGYYRDWPPWLHSNLAWKWRIPALAYWM